MTQARARVEIGAGLVLISAYLFRYPTNRFSLEKSPENQREG